MLLSHSPSSPSTNPTVQVFLLQQFLLLPPVLPCCGKAWPAFKSLLTDPGTSTSCQTPQSGLQEEKKKKPSSGGQPQRGSCSQSRNIVCMCMLDARGEKGRSISCSRGEKKGRKKNQKKQKEIPVFRLQRAGRETQQLKEMLCCYYCMEITATRRNPGRSVAEYNFKKTARPKSRAVHGCQQASAVVEPAVCSPSPSK